MSNVIWKPQPKQALFQSCWQDEALYGGAAGGGKSDALITEALRQVHIKNYRGLIFKSTYPELESLISRSRDLYMQFCPKAKFKISDSTWYFPSGAKIIYGYAQNEQEIMKFSGAPYDFIGIDELTHITKPMYDHLMSRNRAMGPGTRVYARFTCNPDGKGMGWVKARFVTPAKPGSTIWEEQTVRDPDGNQIKVRKSRIFIPATVFDNKRLLENDPGYLARLALLPEAKRKALLEGSFDSFTGMVFTEWIDDPERYYDRKWTHVVAPFPIPQNWKIYRSFDFGYTRPFSVGYTAFNPETNKAYRFLEYYGCVEGSPNEGLKIFPREIAKNIRTLEDTNEILKGRRIFGVADPAIWNKSQGESIAEMMAESPNFIYFEKGDNERLAGLMEFHNRMAFNSEGETMFQVFNTCRGFIRTIPMLVYSQTHIEDVDSSLEDHIYDEQRYCLRMNHLPQRKDIVQVKPQFDPLDLQPKKEKEITYFDM